MKYLRNTIFLKIMMLVTVLASLLLACTEIPFFTRAAIEVANQPEPYQFLDGTEDIPLYRGLKVYGEAPAIYDSLSGRVIDATYFKLETTTFDVEKFYALTLSQLGWVKLASGLYLRDEEQLEITIDEQDGGVIVHFVLSPATE